MHDTDRARLTGMLLCLASAVCFGVAAVFAREATATGLTVPTMLVTRFTLAAAVFWVIVRLGRRGVPTGRLLAACAAMGTLGYAFQSMLYFNALTRIDATLVALLLYVYPAIVVALAVVLRRERAETRTLVALGCSLGGLLLLLGGDGIGAGGVALTGVAMALGAALSYAVYITVAAGVLERADVIAMSAIVCTGAAVSLAVVGAASGTLVRPTAAGLAWSALLGVVSTVGAVGCFFAGVQRIGASRASVLSCLEPVVTALAAMALYGEALTPARLAGGAAVLGAVVVMQSRGRRTQPLEAEAPLQPVPTA